MIKIFFYLYYTYLLIYLKDKMKLIFDINYKNLKI